MRGVYERTGPAADVLIFGEVEKPRTGDGEVLIEIPASGTNPQTPSSLQPGRFVTHKKAVREKRMAVNGQQPNSLSLKPMRMLMPMMTSAETIDVIRHLRQSRAKAVDDVLDPLEQ